MASNLVPHSPLFSSSPSAVCSWASCCSVAAVTSAPFVAPTSGSTPPRAAFTSSTDLPVAPARHWAKISWRRAASSGTEWRLFSISTESLACTAHCPITLGSEVISAKPGACLSISCPAAVYTPSPALTQRRQVIPSFTASCIAASVEHLKFIA